MEHGFNLVELMVSMLLGLMLLGFVVPVILGNLKTFTVANGIARTQENARFALVELSKDIRMAGFRGCDSNGAQAQNLTGNAKYNLAQPFTGEDRSAMEGLAYVSDNSLQLKSAADAITVRLLSQLKTSMTTSLGAGDQTLSLGSVTGLAAGDVLSISDCERTIVVRIASLAGNTITLPTALPADTVFDRSAQVYKVEVKTYFLAKSKHYINESNIAPNSLFRKVNERSVEELVAGIESLQLLYGVDLSGDGAANQFMTATAAATANAPITIVRLHLIATSLNDVGGSGVLSRPFSMSVLVRNNRAS